MPPNTYNNAYLQSSLANAFTNANNALVGHMNGQANREFKMLQLEQANQQAAAQRSHQDRMYNLSAAGNTRAQQLHPHELSKLQYENAQLNNQMLGQQGLVDLFSNPSNFKKNEYGQTYLAPEAVSALAAAQARAKGEVNPNILDFTNMDIPSVPAPIEQNGVILFHPKDPRNPNYQSPAGLQTVENPLPNPLPQSALPQAEFAPQTQDTVVRNQRGEAMGAAPTPSAVAAPPPSAGDPSVADAIDIPPPAFYSPKGKPNVTIVPKTDDGMFGTEKDRFKTVEDAQNQALQASSFAASARRMAQDPAFLEKTRLGVGIPILDQAITAGANFLDTENAKAARQITDVAILDWLTKSTLLKGAITERETAQLRASQPPAYASAENKKQWLEALAWASEREALWNNIRAESAKSGTMTPNVLEWSAQYETQNPRPALLGGVERKQNFMPIQGQGGQSSVGDAFAPAQQGSGQPKSITPDIAVQFLQQAGGDKDRAREMARQAGYSF